MKHTFWTFLILAALVAAGIGGYRIGQHDLSMPSTMTAAAAQAAPHGPVIYYQDPDGQPIYSAEPKRHRTAAPIARFLPVRM